MIVVVALAAAACGDDDDSETSSTTAPTDTTAASGDTTTAAPGEDIIVGGLVAANVFPGAEEGARARFERANREGGVNGRMIKFIGTKDDGNDPARALDLTRELVDQEKVMAIVPVLSVGFAQQSSDVAINAEVPFVGWGFMPGFCGTEYGFGFNGCVVGGSISTAAFEAIALALDKDVQELKYATLGRDNSTGKIGVDFQKQIAEYLDADLVYAESTYPAATTSVDNTPYVQALMENEPDVITLYIDFAGDAGMIAALHGAGYTGVIISNTTYVPGLLETQPDLAAALEDSWSATVIPPAEGNSAHVQQIAADLEAIGEDPFLTLGAQIAWVSADLFIQMLEATEANTGAELAAGVNEGFTYEPIDGGVGPVEFPEGHTITVPCYSVIRIRNAKYEEALPMTCFDLLPT